MKRKHAEAWTPNRARTFGVRPLSCFNADAEVAPLRFIQWQLRRLGGLSGHQGGWTRLQRALGVKCDSS